MYRQYVKLSQTCDCGCTFSWVAKQGGRGSVHK